MWGSPMPSKTKGDKTHKDEHCLKAHECFDAVVWNLTKHIRFHTQGSITPKQLISTIVAMSVERLSIHSINTISDDVSSQTNIKHHLDKINLEELVEKNVILLTSKILNCIPKDRPYQLSTDINEEPYYDKITEINKQFVIGGQVKKSTKQFYKYTSVYLSYKNIKVTLVVLPMKKDVKLIEYVKTLLSIVEKLGIRYDVLLLDKGYYSVPVCNYCKENYIPLIMPVRKKSKKIKYWLGKKVSGKYRYTMRSPKYNSARVDVIVYVQNAMGRRGKQERISYGYVCHYIDWKPRKVFHIYRKRFGIESSYRMENRTKARTSSKDPKIRYLYIVIAMMVKNFWVLFKWKYFCPIRRGPKKIVTSMFRFEEFLNLLWQAFQRRFKIKRYTITLRPVR